MQAAFFTRKFPPSTGGMETFSYQLTHHFSLTKRVVAIGQRQWHIVWAAPLLAIRALLLSRWAHVMHWGDALLAPMAAIVHFFTKRPSVVTVHGLEITYFGLGGLIRHIVLWGLRHVSSVVSVSENTAELLRQSGVTAERITVIPHGVVAPKYVDHQTSRMVLRSQVFQNTIDNKIPIITTVGRLVTRKGVAWLVDQVLPQLTDLPWVYVVASTGPDHERIREICKRHNLNDRIRLIGAIDNTTLEHLYAGSDVFIMPNIVVKNDVEGFGFVAIEAAAHGTFVIASNVDGIPSAIQQKKNGILLAPGDAAAYTTTLRYWLTHPEERHSAAQRGREYTMQHFRWDDIAQQYATLFEQLLTI